MIDDRETNPYATPEDVGEYPIKIVTPADVRRVVWFYRQTIVALVAWGLWVLIFSPIVTAPITHFILRNYGYRRLELFESFVILSFFVIWWYSIYVVFRTLGSMRYNFFFVLLTLLSCYPLITWAMVVAARIAAYYFLKRHCERVRFWRVQMRPETESEVDF